MYRATFTRFTHLLLLLILVLSSLGESAIGPSTALAAPAASATAQAEGTVIALTDAGFSPREATIDVGDTIIWRNQTAAPLALKSGPVSSVFLPLIAGREAAERSTAQAASASAPSQLAEGPAFDTLVAPGGEFSFKFTSVGSFSFFDAAQPASGGTINVLSAGPPIVSCEEETSSAVGSAEQELPGLLYATAEDRTLLRWYWDDCTTASFAVYRSTNGGPEQLLATVTPVTDPAAAEALLNTTDARWPSLASHFNGRLLTAGDLSRDQQSVSVTDLYNYLYTNGLAGVYLTNQYYPLALMLGWGYLDTAITPGESYSYRVEALAGGADGGPLELGQVELSAGQRTPLPAPTGVVTGDLDLEEWQGDWGSYQRNRRYDGQIYLDWNLGSGLGATDPLSPALTIGYDVFRATATAEDGSVIAGEKILAPDAEDSDAIVLPGPTAEGEVEYLFRYAPGDYEQHTLCVAPRDLLNQAIRWPEDAAQCSAPITVEARDYQPPAAPEQVTATALDNSSQVNVTWVYTSVRDLDHFIIQRSQDLHCVGSDCWTDMVRVPANRRSWSDLASPCANDPLIQEGCWYRVVALDAADNRSAPSKAAYAINHDTLPPNRIDISNSNCDPSKRYDPDNNLCVDIDTPAVSIRVNCVLSPGGDEVFIAEVDDADYSGLDLVGLIKSVYQPPLHLIGVPCRFILVDEYGNLSDIDDSTPIKVDVYSDSPDQLAQPVITDIATVFEGPGNWAATVSWEMAAHPMLASFVIQREHNGVLQNFNVNDVAARSFTDTDVVQGERYTYVVQANAAYGDINDTLSEPRSHRILDGENRPLEELTWAQNPAWTAGTASTTLQVNASPVAEGDVVNYAVFRSLRSDRNFLQITPVLQATGATIFYNDTSAQRPCYYYVVVSFRQRDGEPNGYSDPRQPGGCAQAIPTIYTPGPALDPPPAPAPLCAPAAQSLAPGYNFRFGGGFQVAVEGLNENYTGPGRVDGGGWLLVETQQETLSVPMSFRNLTVDATGRVCSGTATVNLSTLPGGGLDLQVAGGWRYRLRAITLQPWFDQSNNALATLDLFTGSAFTNYDLVGASASRIELADVRLTNSLRFSYAEDFTPGPGHSCASPAVAFRLETLPLDVIPSGPLTIDEQRIEFSSACTSYVDRYNPLGAPLVNSPYEEGQTERLINDGYLAEPLSGGAVSITPSGLDGVFSTVAPLEWYAAYPFAVHMQVAGGLSVAITDSQISGGALGNGTARLIHHQSVDDGQQVIVEAAFSGLFIGAGGDLVGTLSMGRVAWDAFAIPAGNWALYQGALTTPGLPATHNVAGQGQAIMWQAHPSDVQSVAIPGGALPGLLEPGFNRREAAATLDWDNCGATASFTNVAMDAYLRRAGLTQRHIPLYSADSRLDIHGYDFIPERFDLHFFDNALLEREISGVVSLPFPSDIDVRLVNVWLTGDLNDPAAGEAACIGGGDIPEGEQDKRLAYWAVDARFHSAEFRQQSEPTTLWLVGDLHHLPHLTVGAGEATLPVALAFNPDGNLRDDPQSGPNYDRPDYRFQGFPYLLERFRLSDWGGAGLGEVPTWEERASANDQPADAIWNISGFVGLRGVPVAPYFGPLMIDAAPDSDQLVMAAWNPSVVGFAAQPRVSKEWVKVARIRITFDYDHLVHVYDAASGTGRFVGFKDYRFVPDRYLEFDGIPQPVEEQIEQLQVLQLDTGVVIAPNETGVYLGLSSGVAALRALAQAQGGDQPAYDVWAERLAINPTATNVYIAQLALAVQQAGAFDYRATTDVLDTLSDASLENLLDQDNVGGRTQGLLAERGVNIRRLRGIVEVEGEGLATQFKRFQLSTQVEIKGRDQSPAEQALALADDPSLEEDPPLFYAERMTLSIERHGDFMLVGKGIESSQFSEKLESFDATLVINATEPQFEGGLTLYGLKAGSVTIDNGSAVLGVGKTVNYLGLSFDGRFGAGSGEIEVGGDLLAGRIDTSSPVLENNFADAINQIANDVLGEEGTEDLNNMRGFYMRAYGGQIPIIGNSCMLSLQADAELAFWYWKTGGGQNFGGLLKPAVYGQVLCAVDARGDLRLYYQQVNGQDSFSGEGYIAGGIGQCDPGNWGAWGERWWDDGLCMQAGAGLSVLYAEADGWSVDYNADYERLFGD